MTLVLLAVSVAATSINVDSPLMQGTQWSFEAEFSLDNVDEVRLFVAGEQALVGIVYNSEIQVIDATISSKVIDYSVTGNKVVAVMSGMSAGTYQVEAKTYDNSNILDEIISDVEFFQPVSRSEQDALQNKVSGMEGTIMTLNSEIDSLESQLTTKDDQITSLKNDNQALSTSLDHLEGLINTLEHEGKTQEEILVILKDDLNVLMTEREESMKSPLAGLFAFGSENSPIILGLIALIAIIVVGVFVKSRGSSIYSGLNSNEDAPIAEDAKSTFMDTYKPKPSPIRGFLNKMHKDNNPEAPVATKKRKWAVESYSPSETKKPKQDKNFELGDLIKRE
jgi:hypothetical protein